MTVVEAVAGAGLTCEQEEAIERRRGALLLAANAGSGKTTVLVERFVRAVHVDGVAPSRILAITFTERAAGEVRERVRRRLHELGDRAAARETEAAFVSTIHGFCARLLRSHPLAAGLAPGFAVLDEGTALGLRERAFERALAAWMADARAVDLAGACGVDQLAAAIGAVHDGLRSRGRTRPRLPDARPRHDPAVARAALAVANYVVAAELAGARPGPRVAAALAQLERDPLTAPLEELKLHRGARALQTVAADAYEAARQRCVAAEADAGGVVGLELVAGLLAGFAAGYAALKAARGALDFDDLELCARDLLTGHEELRAQWSERFELLMVDELQDTNPREMAIIGALDRGNLFTVGDEFQSIYGFRHADVGIFRERRRALAGVDGVRALSRNFRSRPAILAAINATFAPIFGLDFVELVPGRDDPPGAEEPAVEILVNDAKGWEEPESPGAGPAWRRAEAAILARRIEELIVEGAARPGEIVVLLRYATAAGIYERALADRGVAVAPSPGGGFYLAPEVCDLAAYARVLANPLDDVALYGVLASPIAGVGADGLATLGLAAKALGRPPWEVLDAGLGGEPAAAAALAPLGSAERARLAAGHELIAAERAQAPGRGLAELLVRSGYRERAGCGALGVANLAKLSRLAREFEAREGRDLRRFADILAEGRLGSAREQDAQLAETDAVRLMTVHAAKGLEFPVVCYADLGHGPPIGLPLVLTDGERVGLRLSTLAATKPEAFAYADLRGERDRAALAEERRIAYVAMTRARDRLILSGAADFARWPTPGAAAPTIAWLAPAMIADLPARLAGPAGVSELDVGGVPVRLTLTPAGETARLAEATVRPACPGADGPPGPAGGGAAAPAGDQIDEMPASRGGTAQLTLFDASWPAAAPHAGPASPTVVGLDPVAQPDRSPASVVSEPPAGAGGPPAPVRPELAAGINGASPRPVAEPSAGGAPAPVRPELAAGINGASPRPVAKPSAGGAPAPVRPEPPAGADGAPPPGQPAGPPAANAASALLVPAPPAAAHGVPPPVRPEPPAAAHGASPPVRPEPPAVTNGAPAPVRPELAAGINGASPRPVAEPSAGADGVPPPGRPEPPAGADGAPPPGQPAGPPAANAASALLVPAPPAAAHGVPPPVRPEPPAAAHGASPPVRPEPPAVTNGAPAPVRPEPPAVTNGAPAPVRPEPPAVTNGAALRLMLEPPAGECAPPPAPLATANGASPRRAPEPAPLTVSYSSLADHARCGYGYYLRRVVGLAEVAPPPGLAAESAGDPVARGRIVHQLLERLDFARPQVPSAALLADAVAGAAAPGVDPGEIAGLIAAFAASPLCRRLAAADSVRREASFTLSVGGLLVDGYLDVVAREADGHLLVVDYKTDRLAPDEDLAARVTAAYELQRRIYALAALQTGVPSVEVVYCFVRRPGDVVVARFGPADAARLERDLADAAAPLRAGRFEVTTRPHRRLCATCPGRARLCSWGEEVTLGDAVHRG